MDTKISYNVATVEQAVELGLKKDEFDHICEILGRTPNFTELSIYSVMWSLKMDLNRAAPSSLPRSDSQARSG